MKKHLLRFIALIVFASAISSCSIEYRQRHMREHDGDRHERHDRN